MNLIKGGVLALAGAAVATALTLLYRRKNSIPKGAVPFSPFDLESYLGKWYEVARIDTPRERRLTNTTLEYGIDDERGAITIALEGYNSLKDKWERTKGEAQFVGDPSVAALEVSFGNGLFTGHNVIAIEGQYDYALVVGRTNRFCRILSRTPHLPEDVRARFVSEAMRIGVQVNSLRWVEHSDIQVK